MTDAMSWIPAALAGRVAGMTDVLPETEIPAYVCRHCNQPVEQIEGDWTDLDGCVVCTSNMASLTAGHQPACPPSAVADMIIRWDELQPGDLFVHEESWAVALKVSTYEDDWQGTKWMRTDILYRDDSGVRPWCIDRHTDRLVAVRRYVTDSWCPPMTGGQS
jgi:hypothetical protein